MGRKHWAEMIGFVLPFPCPHFHWVIKHLLEQRKPSYIAWTSWLSLPHRLRLSVLWPHLSYILKSYGWLSASQWSIFSRIWVFLCLLLRPQSWGLLNSWHSSPRPDLRFYKNALLSSTHLGQRGPRQCCRHGYRSGGKDGMVTHLSFLIFNREPDGLAWPKDIVFLSKTLGIHTVVVATLGWGWWC